MVFVSWSSNLWPNVGDLSDARRTSWTTLMGRQGSRPSSNDSTVTHARSTVGSQTVTHQSKIRAQYGLASTIVLKLFCQSLWSECMKIGVKLRRFSLTSTIFKNKSVYSKICLGHRFFSSWFSKVATWGQRWKKNIFLVKEEFMRKVSRSKNNQFQFERLNGRRSRRFMFHWKRWFQSSWLSPKLS